MEELKPDYIKSKIQENNEQILKSGEDDNDKTIKINDTEQKNTEIDDNIIDPKKELEQIKLSHIKQYSFLELFKKSFSFSKSNLALPILNLSRKFCTQFIDIKIPIIYGKLLNSIIKERYFEKLCYEFKSYIFYSFLKIIINYIQELIGLIIVKQTVFQNKKIVLKNIAEKDVEFFDLYRTGEIVDGIKKNENMLDNNFIFKTCELMLDLFNFFYLLYFLKKTSFKLMIIFFSIQLIKFELDVLLKQYTDFRNRKKKNESTNKYNSLLYEFISNIRLIKSMSLEDLYLEKLNNLKLKFFKSFCSIDGIVGPVFDFLNKVLDTFIIFMAGKYAINGEIEFSDFTVFRDYSNKIKANFIK